MDDSSPASQYEALKRRNWNSFLNYLNNRHKPPLKLSQCTGHDVVEFLRYLDQFGKTRVHSDRCRHFTTTTTTASNLLEPPPSCSCPAKQSWEFLDSVVGRLRAAYEEEEEAESRSNPFAHNVVTSFLEDVKVSQERATSTNLSKKKKNNSNKRKNPSPNTADDGAVGASDLKAKRKSLVAANVSGRTDQSSGAVQSSDAIVDMPDGLPFKVGQLAESTSFEEGFRGAWFRCKLKSISWEKDQIGYTAEYYDFPDEEEKWAKLYEVAPYDRILKKCLMVRPQYPSMYHESKMPRVNSISETIIIVKGAWKVGNLVDWHEKDCYWPARITQVFDDDKVQLELPMPPAGEGGSYEAYSKDLRPSLDWTPEHGWRLCLQEGGVSCCARLIHPLNHGLKVKRKDNITSQSEAKHISSQVGRRSSYLSGSNEFMIKESKKMMKGKGNILSASKGKPVSAKVGRQSYFTSCMTPFNIKMAALYIPANFAKANGLSKRSCEVLMRDDQQRLWTASIKQKTNAVCLRGWRNFQVANDVKEGDVFRIELLEDGEKPVIHFHYLENKPVKAHDKAKITMFSTPNRHPCFISTLKASNFNKSLLYLPQEFARANGLGQGEMILKNEYQDSWTVELRDVGRYVYVASGWSDFRVANELKEGDSFKFELIENGKKPVAIFYRISSTDRDQNLKVPSDGQAGTRSPVCASLSSRISANKVPVPLEEEIVLSEEDMHQTEQVEALDDNVGDESVFSKASLSESISTSHVQEFTTVEEGGCSSHESMTTGGTIKLNSMHNDTLEAAILDLEELANKVKWINAILNYKNRFCNDTRPSSWKFVEHPSLSTPR